MHHGLSKPSTNVTKTEEAESVKSGQHLHSNRTPRRRLNRGVGKPDGFIISLKTLSYRKQSIL